MTSFTQVARRIDALTGLDPGASDAPELLALSEQILEHWVHAQGEQPTNEQMEGFRLLALHRQGARGRPSFNACRETCREIAYHYLLLTSPTGVSSSKPALMMAMLAQHLSLFVGGKLEIEGLGEFCCASRPIRAEAD